MTLVERKSGFVLLAKLSSMTSDLVVRAIEATLMPLNSRAKTLMVYSGKEFADHKAIDQALGIQTIFTDPPCIWQRGSKANFNVLLPKYIPKKGLMETVTEEELTMIETDLITGLESGSN